MTFYLLLGAGVAIAHVSLVCASEVGRTKYHLAAAAVVGVGILLAAPLIVAFYRWGFAVPNGRLPDFRRLKALFDVGVYVGTTGVAAFVVADTVVVWTNRRKLFPFMYRQATN